MKKYFFLSLLLSLGLHSESSMLHSKAKSVNQPENIQVLIEKNVSEALLEVKGPYYIYNPDDGSKIASGILGKRFIVHGLEKGLKWGEFFPGTHQIYIVPRSEETSILVNGIQYDGAIAVYHIDNDISIINDVSIENYIKATLSPQFYIPLDQEAMAAIAIVARTNTYHIVEENKGKYWHIDAASAKYLGSSMIRPGSEIDKAVEETTNLILTNSELSPFAAKWTDHCAGKTAPFSAVYRKDGKAPDLSVESTIALFDRNQSTWNFQISKAKLAQLFELTSIKEIDLYVDTASNKAYAIRLKDDKTEKSIDFFKFQKAIGKKIIQSNDFTITSTDDSIIFTGYGVGDGVGLCLYSADVLSQKGEDALSILEKFYPTTKLVNLSATPQYDKKNVGVKR